MLYEIWLLLLFHVIRYLYIFMNRVNIEYMNIVCFKPNIISDSTISSTYQNITLNVKRIIKKIKN